MRIITISREFGSGGRELGKRLADLLGFDYYDSEIITVVAKQSGLDAGYVEKKLSNHGWQAYPVTFRGTMRSSGYMQSNILCLGKTKFDASALFKACTNGSSEFMSNISMSIVGILYNLQLMKYAGENGVAAYGVMMYVSMIFSAAFVGYSIGTTPVISYHDGAQNRDELKGLLRKSLVLVGSFGLAMILSAEFLASPLSKVFVGYDAELFDLTVSGMRIFALSFGFMGFGIFASGFFTALNDGLTSALISFLRTLVFQSGAIMLLPMLWGIDGVWISVVVAEFMSLVLGGFFLIVKRKTYHY